MEIPGHVFIPAQARGLTKETSGEAEVEKYYNKGKFLPVTNTCMVYNSICCKIAWC